MEFLEPFLPDDDMKPFTLKLDNAAFDPNDPAGSLAKYAKNS